MKPACGFVVGMLASLGLIMAAVLAGHPLARYALHEAIQQDVAALGRVLWH